MSKRGGLPVSPQPSKPPGKKSARLHRAGRPPQLVSSKSLRRKSKASLSPNADSDDINSNSASRPRSTFRDNEPATDEDSHDHSSCSIPSEPQEHENYSQLETSERQAVAMFRKITRKSERNHQKYNSFRDSISGKDKQVEALHASFEDLARQTAGLEVLCNSDMDGETLNKLFMTIPLQQRQLYLGE